MVKKKTEKDKKKPAEEYIFKDAEIQEVERVAASNPAVAKLYNIYMDYLVDPSKTWRSMVVFAQRELNIELKNKTLDIMEDGFHKSIWEILKGGAPVAKTIKSAMEEIKDDEDLPDKELQEAQVVKVITAETAGR